MSDSAQFLLTHFDRLAEAPGGLAKVDELMAVLDALAAARTTARTTAESLLAATIAKLHAA